MKYDQWITDLIEELHAHDLIDDDCTRSWVTAHRPVMTGERTALEAYEAFIGCAETHYETSPATPNDQGDIYVFEDGSCWASWKDGIDHFYQSVSDIRAENGDVDEWFTENEKVS